MGRSHEQLLGFRAIYIVPAHTYRVQATRRLWFLCGPQHCRLDTDIPVPSGDEAADARRVGLRLCC